VQLIVLAPSTRTDEPPPKEQAMVKKMKSTAAKAAPKREAGLLDNELASSVKDSAQQIWLAGMGAFSKAQEEGTKVFEALVKEGQSLQKKTQGIAEEKISEVTGKMSAMAGTVSAKAGQNWDKLEAIFEQRTAKAMNKLGVPTAKDVDTLVKRVDALAAAVAKLSKGTPAKAAPAKAPRAARKAAAPAPEAQAVAPVKAAAKAPAKRARKSAPAA
jgi:poly(hydroxyalkanoate) granule-associated protein